MKEPATYLMVTMDGGGNIPPMFGMAQKLMDRGHTVHLLTEPCLEGAARKAGLRFHPFVEYFTRTDRTEDIFKDWKKKGIKDPTLDNVVFGPARTVVAQTVATMEKTQPDVLIVDLLLIPALMAAETRGIPTVLGFHMPEYFPGANRPPGMMGLLPGKGPFGRLRDRLLGAIFTKVLDSYRKDLNAIRQDYQLPPLRHTMDLAREADLRLIQTSRSFDFPLEPAPANVRYTGPILTDPDWVEPWDSPWPASDTRPLVVVAFSSTFQNQAAVIGNCIEALSRLPARGLVTAGPALAKYSLPGADNVVVIDSAPHSQVFPQADVVITHAGHGTVMRALSYGVPLLCMPMGRDQSDNAAKVAYHKVGIALNKNARVSGIQKGVEKLLHDARYRQAAGKLGGQIRHDSQSAVLVHELEQLVEASRAGKEKMVQAKVR